MAPLQKAGIMMILSPAKTLDLIPLADKNDDNDNIPDEETHFTWPDCDAEQTSQVAQAIKAQPSAKALGKLLGISDNLAKASYQYWIDFEVDQKSRPVEETKPSIYSFSGAAYQGLQAMKRSQEAMLYLQDNLRIVDAVYGMLKPLDRMQPYRLEMATRNVFEKSSKTEAKLPKKLNEFWRGPVTERLAQELAERPKAAQILLNLASDEYAAAVDSKNLQGLVPNAQYVKVVFRHQGRVIAVHAKRARGLMVRYLADEGAQTLDDVRKFDLENYRLDTKNSDTTTLVFDRSEAPAATGGSKRKKAPKDTKTTGSRTSISKAKAAKPSTGTKAKKHKGKNASLHVEDPNLLSAAGDGAGPPKRRRSARQSRA